MWLLVAAVLGFDFYVRYFQTKTAITTSTIRDALTIIRFIFLSLVLLLFLLKFRWTRAFIVLYAMFEFSRYIYMFEIGYIPLGLTVLEILAVALIMIWWFFLSPPITSNGQKKF